MGGVVGGREGGERGGGQELVKGGIDERKFTSVTQHG
jgi:hypothetical protein